MRHSDVDLRYHGTNLCLEQVSDHYSYVTKVNYDWCSGTLHATGATAEACKRLLLRGW